MANKIEFIGAKPYETTFLRKDRRNGSRPSKPGTAFGHIGNLRLPKGRRPGITYHAIIGRCRREDEEINQAVPVMFIRAVFARKGGKVSHLLWSGDVGPSKVSRMNKVNKRKLIPWFKRPIPKKLT